MFNADTATPKALIVRLTPHDGAPDAPLAALAAAAGYRFVDQKEYWRDGLRPAIAVVDLRGDASASAIDDAVGNARALAPAAGVVILAPAGFDPGLRARLRRCGDVTYLNGDPSPAVAAIREKLRLFGLADETAERIKSLVADGRAVSLEGLREGAASLSVLIAGKAGPLSLNASNALAAAGAEMTSVFSAGQVMRALDHRRFDAAIFLPADENDLLIALARALRRHREHRRLPVIMASTDDALLDRCAARDGFDAIFPAHIDADLAQRIGALARRARMSAAMRAFLRSADGSVGKTGAASARFFAHHAIRAFVRADGTGESISIVGLALTARNREGAIAGALNDALRTVKRIIRAEDLISKLTPTTLVFLMRNASEDEAAKIAARLEGVIAGTLMRSTLEIARVSAAGVERRSGDDIETTIARLIRALHAGASPERAAR